MKFGIWTAIKLVSSIKHVHVVRLWSHPEEENLTIKSYLKD